MIEILIKILPMVTLVLFMNNMSSIKKFNNQKTSSMITGMFSSIIGDVCLVPSFWQGFGKDMFLPGVLVFGIGHGFYIKAFGLKWDNTTLIGPLAYYGYFITSMFVVDDEVLNFAVHVYVIIILMMVWRGYADNSSFKGILETGSIWGSLFFAISDSMLGLGKFSNVHEFLNEDYGVQIWNWLVYFTYILGQLGIAISCLSVKEVEKDATVKKQN